MFYLKIVFVYDDISCIFTRACLFVFHVTEIPIDPIEPTSLVDGDIIPWQPTAQDLTMFFELLLRWQDPGRETVRFRKTAIVVCGSEIPFTTRIQETKTGEGWTKCSLQSLSFSMTLFSSSAFVRKYSNIILKCTYAQASSVNRLL